MGDASDMAVVKDSRHMEIEVRDEQGVTVLEPKGSLTFPGGDVAFTKAIAEVLEAGSQNILTNLAGVNAVDSSGIGDLVSATSAARRKGILVKMRNLTAQLKTVFEATQLFALFEVFDSKEEAIRSFPQ